MTVVSGDSAIFVAGHRGLVGSAIVRRLRSLGWREPLMRTHAELDLADAAATLDFFRTQRPEVVVLAAAKVGGILANDRFPADFIRDNLAIQLSVIDAAYKTGVERLLFLGSSCIYPKFAPQPMRERDMLTGPLEPTNRPYALAKIAGIEMCWSYNRQYKTRYLAAMPTNLYGRGDNYHPTNSHVIPALIRKFHEAKLRGDESIVLWGTGTARREFLYSDDMADACVHLMGLPDERYSALLGSSESETGRFEPPLVNIGVGTDITIAELATVIGRVVGYRGGLQYDPSQPDGTPRKLMDVSLLHSTGWSATTTLEQGLEVAYAEFRTDRTSSGNYNSYAFGE